MTRHCAKVNNVNSPQLLLGIWQIFDPWVEPRLQALQGYNVPEITRPLTIEFHFRRVVHRLIRSLGRLYRHFREWDRFIKEGGLASGHPELVFEIPEEAGIAADSVFHYLNLFIDDLARVIPFVFAEEGLTLKEPDGFSALKRMIVNGKLPVSQNLRGLFESLDEKDSWWSLGFSRGIGIRQRLVHYTDLIYFSGRSKEGDTNMSAVVSLITVGGPRHLEDFEKVLKKLLREFCEWLDQVDYELLTFLSNKLGRKGITWNPFNEPIPSIRLQENFKSNFEDSTYFYFIVCR